MQPRVDCLAIVAATGTGKSALAMELALRSNGEIIGADALQIYRGLDIGTAKPSVEDRRRVRHHLIDILDPHERFSAGEFARRAASTIEEVMARRRLPVVVGGSGLYVRALLEGLSPLPTIEPQVREELERRLEQEGLEALFDELRRRDEATARRLSRNDRQRILRALEVSIGTGRALSSWHRMSARKASFSASRIGLTLPREVLYDRLESRVHQMLESGWLEEVRDLITAGVSRSSPAFQAIGYRELVSHLRGECSLEASTRQIVQSTQRYAKRQLTWFRKQAGFRWFDASRPESLLEEILEHLRAEGCRSEQ